MGRPKAALMFGKRTILECLIGELQSTFAEILVIAAPVRSQPFPVEELLREAPPSVRLLRDHNPYEGAAVALAKGLKAAVNDVAFACSCDLPLLRAEVARSLCAMLNGYEAVVPRLGGHQQPLCAVYRCRVAAMIETQLASGQRRLTHITEALKAYHPTEEKLRELDLDLRSFLNVNSPEDFQRALALKAALEGSS